MQKTLIHRVWALLKLPFVRKLATFQVSTILIALINFASSVIQARLLGLQLFGLLAVILAFAGLLNFFTSMGQETTLATFFSEAFGKKHHTNMTLVIRYFLQMTLISMMIVAVFAILAPLLSDLFQGNTSIGNYARIPILIVALQSPPTLYFLILQLHNRVKAIAVYETTRNFLQLILCTVFLLLGFGIWGVLLSMLIPAVIYFPMCLYLYERDAKKLHLPSLMNVISTLTKTGTGMYVRQGLWITIDKSINNNVYPNLFLMALSAVAPLETVGVFKIALRLASLPATMIMPNISRLTNVNIPLLLGKNRAALKDASIKVIKGSVGLSILAALGAAIVVPPLIPFVYGKAYSAAALPFLILLPLNIFSASAVVTTPLLRVLQRTYISLINTVTSMTIGLGLFYLFKTMMPPLIAMSLAIIYVYAQIIFLHLYIWHLVRRRKLTA